MITFLLILIAFIALGGGIYLFATEHERNMLINAKISNHDVIRLAQEFHGRLSVGLLAQKTSLDFTEAERKLYMMLSEGIFQHEYDENYQPIFVLNTAISLPTVPTKDIPYKAQTSKGLPAQVPDGEVIRIAVECKGKITASLLCMKAKLQFEEAQIILERLQRKGVFDVEVNQNGTIVYILEDWEMMQGNKMEINIQFAKKSLLGLSIGDAFGDSFFGDYDQMIDNITKKEVPLTTKWEFTDDTVMAIAIFEILEKYGFIQQDELAQLFAQNYQKDINRGYGATAHRVLREIGEGYAWRIISSEVFEGQGSMGNGGAMRVAPLGAYFYGNHDKIIAQAMLSAKVTHFNHEAKVGACAIALAASLAIQWKQEGVNLGGEAFITQIHQQLQDSDTKSKIGKSLSLPKAYRVETVTSILGNGTKLLAQDTVPFALWCIAHYLDNFEEALWIGVSGLGDRDTICAMVGSVVILYANEQTIPTGWQNSVEKIKDSIFWNNI